MWPRRASTRDVELLLRLVVPVHVDPRRVHAPREREVQLAGRGHVAGQALLAITRNAAVHGNAFAAYSTSKLSVRARIASM